MNLEKKNNLHEAPFNSMSMVWYTFCVPGPAEYNVTWHLWQIYNLCQCDRKAWSGLKVGSAMCRLTPYFQPLLYLVSFTSLQHCLLFMLLTAVASAPGMCGTFSMLSKLTGNNDSHQSVSAVVPTEGWQYHISSHILYIHWHSYWLDSDLLC